MTKLQITGLCIGASLLLLTACNDGIGVGDSGAGTISPSVTYDPTVITASGNNSSRAAEIQELTVEDLTLTLTNEDGSVNESFPAVDFPSDREFAVGKYTMTASYGDPDDEGFEKPAVLGQTELTVSEGRTTSVDLTATPSKAMVSLTFDKSLTDYMTSLSAHIRSAAGNDVEYYSSESRPAYMKPGTISLSLDVVKPNGVSGTIQVNEFQAEAAHHYKVNLSLGGDGAGSVESIVVSYDDLLEEEEITVDISDIALSVPAPTVTAVGFADGDLLTVNEGEILSVAPRFNIEARGGIASAILTTTGANLLAAGWPAEIDLAQASSDRQQTLTDLGFKNIGVFNSSGAVLAAFDLGGVIAKAPATAEDAEPAEFTLIVTDANGKQSQPLGFRLTVKEVKYILDAADNDVFATSAWVSVSHLNYDVASKTIKLYASTNGSDFTEVSGTQSGAEFHATGLTAATEYTLMATIDGTESTTATITTEAATQIPNGNLDSTDADSGWRTIKTASAGATTVNTIGPPSPWDTNNLETTSTVSSVTNNSALNAVEATSDAISGNAALIRTVGVGQTTIFDTPQRFHRGELFFNGGFSSRPASLRFSYKHTAYSSGETGLVVIRIFDANGNEIASATKNLSPTGSYTAESVPLNYTRGSSKAATAQVYFYSTDVAQPNSTHCQNIQGGVGYWGNQPKNYGSALYVDDIELTY